MKTHRYPLIAITALMLTAFAPHSSAAEVTVDISSFAPRDPDSILAQIELNVLLKQYEKLLIQLEEVRFEMDLTMTTTSSDETEESKKQIEKLNTHAEARLGVLQESLFECRTRIEQHIIQANKRRADIEKEAREMKKKT